MANRFSNAYETTLNGAIDNSQTTFDVTSVTGKPAAVPFLMRIKEESGNTNEIVKVTGVASNTFTVVRAAEAYAGVQSASAHSNGAPIEHVLTAATINTLSTLDFPGTWLGSIPWANSTTGANTIHYSRIIIPFNFEPNRIGITIQTSAGNLDLGIYNDDGTGTNPGTLLVSTGSTASPGTGTRLFTISPGLIVPGVYWLAFVSSSGTTSVGYLMQGTGNGGGGPIKCLRETTFPLPSTAGTSLSSSSWTAAVWLEKV